MVIRTYRDGVHVLKVTSQPGYWRHKYILIDNSSWGRMAKAGSKVDLSNYYEMSDDEFIKRIAVCDGNTWYWIQKDYVTGWVC